MLRRRSARPAPRHAATVIARNYLPHARVLARSLAAHHPGLRLAVLLVDGDHHDRDRDEPFELLVPADIDVTQAELHRRAMLMGAQGVISALRPRLVRHLRAERDGGTVLLIDADMEAYAPLDDLWALAEDHGIALSPHSSEPIPGTPGSWPEELFLINGTFNGGLLGLGPGSEEFIEWLLARTDYDCLRDPARGLLYSQTWLNLVPALFASTVIRDRGVNTMVHNLRGTDITWQAGRAVVEGTPLRLFHFSGFDPGNPGTFCRYFPGEDFAHFGQRAGLRRLASAYGERLLAGGWTPEHHTPWTTLSDGTPVDDASRAIYRRTALAAARGEVDAPPDPFAPDGAFIAWLHADDGDGYSRYLAGLHLARPDLAAAFPAIPGADVAAYLAWAAAPGNVGPPFAPTI